MPKTKQTASGELLTLKELSERLRMHPDTVRGLYRRGVIPGLKLGHRTLRFDFDRVYKALEKYARTEVERYFFTPVR